MSGYGRALNPFFRKESVCGKKPFFFREALFIFGSNLFLKGLLKKKKCMDVKVKILAGKEEERRIEVANDDTYEKVLEKLGINPEEVVVLRNGKPVPEDEPVVNKNSGEITIIRIVSSG